MEVALWTFLTGLWWVSSCSFLLPMVLLLKYSRTFRDHWFSWFYSTFLVTFCQPKLLPLRQQCFRLLKKEMSQRDPSVPLRILEIGIGTGANLQLYPENSTVIAVDVNSTFGTYFEQNSKKFPHVKLEKIIHAMAEDMKEVEDSSVDIVISTYVLCSVQDVKAVLKEVKRVLVPGGKFLFVEHVAYPKDQWSFTVQKLGAPLWSLYFAGCCPHRDISGHVDSAEFSKVIYERVEPSSLNIYIRPQVMGLAFK